MPVPEAASVVPRNADREPLRANAADLFDAIAKGHVKVDIGARFRLDEIAAIVNSSRADSRPCATLFGLKRRGQCCRGKVLELTTMRKHLLLALIFALTILLPLTSADAQRGRDDWRPDNRTDWESLGTAEIGTRLERDVIPVGRREGRFSSIGFTVTGSDVQIERLKIVYGNGEADDLTVRETFKNGTRSRPIDLPGRATSIDSIEVTYRSPGAVKLEFFGEKRREPEWQQLGCQRVGFLDKEDAIRVGRREGAFSALKLQVSDATLRLNRLRIVFGNGTSQTFDVRSAIPAGAETRPLDLDGSRRAIERIELDYLPSISLKRGAQVCVLAIEGDGRRGPGGPGRRDDRDGRRDRDRR